MLWSAVKCILWELAILVQATLAINITIVCLYDDQGNSRKEMKELFRKEK